MRELLVAIGEDPDREGLRDTPARVARAYAEVTGGLRMRPEDAHHDVRPGHDEMVLVRDIALWSMCEHHLVLFGVAHVGYIPPRAATITASKTRPGRPSGRQATPGVGAADHPGRRRPDAHPQHGGSWSSSRPSTCA